MTSRIMKCTAIILLSIFLAVNFSKGQATRTLSTRRDSVELVKALMRENGDLTSHLIGSSAYPSKQYYRFLFLLSTLTTPEILELSKDSSACIRAYAYAGLVHNRYRKIKEIESQLKNDSSRVKVHFGCNGGHVYLYAVPESLKQWYHRKSASTLVAKLREDNDQYFENYILGK